MYSIMFLNISLQQFFIIEGCQPTEEKMVPPYRSNIYGHFADINPLIFSVLTLKVLGKILLNSMGGGGDRTSLF